jgi:hypothetical protein
MWRLGKGYVATVKCAGVKERTLGRIFCTSSAP